MKVGLLRGLSWLMDEMLTHYHSQPRLMCAWPFLGFLLHKNITSLLAIGFFTLYISLFKFV